MRRPLLDLMNLSTDLSTGGEVVHAVNDVSFSIERGETFCLVGESGSGKSITALSVIRLLPHGIASHPQGNILFYSQQESFPESERHGINLLELDENAMQQVRGAHIAMIFQEPMSSLNPVFTIGEQIMEALLLHNPGIDPQEAMDRTLAALEQVQIPHPRSRFNDYPHQLSGGQRQRVMIAMALACEPELLIADEPTTALDVTVQAEILRLMRELQDNTGMSTLFITHDFGVVAQMAQKVGVMQQGRLVETGPVDQVLHHPQHPYTRQLLASVPENLPRRDSQPSLHSGEQPAPPQPDNGGKGATGMVMLEGDTPLIQVRDLRVWFPIRKGLLRRVVDHVKAVDGVDLMLPRGKIIAVVGESGCGKTTLGRAILQLETPTAGSVQMAGTELTGLDHRGLRPWRARMQIAFQDPQSSLNPRLPIHTTLTEPMKVHGISQSQEERLELAGRLLERVQLKRDYLWRYPHEFSGGQRQRIGLARALVLNPEFIVCDEITSALDVSVQAEILQLLQDIRAERDLTLLFITHNMGVVEYLSDRTVVMYQGKIVENGLTAQVCGDPAHAYTRKLLAAVPRLQMTTA